MAKSNSMRTVAGAAREQPFRVLISKKRTTSLTPAARSNRMLVSSASRVLCPSAIDASHGPTVSVGTFFPGQIIALRTELGRHLRANRWLAAFACFADFCFVGHLFQFRRHPAVCQTRHVRPGRSSCQVRGGEVGTKTSSHGFKRLPKARWHRLNLIAERSRIAPAIMMLLP